MNPESSSDNSQKVSKHQQKKRNGGGGSLCGFRRPAWFFLAMLVLVLLVVDMAQGIDFFGMDNDCLDNPMRKPSRFGKRSHPVADLSSELDPSTGLPLATRVRRASSDCFRGPLRRRTLRQSAPAASAAAAMPSLSSVAGANVGLMNRFNQDLFRTLLRASLRQTGGTGTGIGDGNGDGKNGGRNRRMDSDALASRVYAFEQQMDSPTVVQSPTNPKNLLVRNQDSDRGNRAQLGMGLREFMAERAKARAKASDPSFSSFSDNSSNDNTSE